MISHYVMKKMARTFLVEWIKEWNCNSWELQSHKNVRRILFSQVLTNMFHFFIWLNRCWKTESLFECNMHCIKLLIWWMGLNGMNVSVESQSYYKNNFSTVVVGVAENGEKNVSIDFIFPKWTTGCFGLWRFLLMMVHVSHVYRYCIAHEWWWHVYLYVSRWNLVLRLRHKYIWSFVMWNHLPKSKSVVNWYMPLM